jgi:MerR family transcriptional regulator, light-induced transcriptional regulator
MRRVSTPPGRSIGELAAATGVAPGTLRMWEARHGFPEPRRHGSGDRRYGPDDAARVTQVLRERERGLSLAAAIERVRGWSPAVAPTLFAALRERQPELQPRRLPLPAMLALSRAIEDECLARAARPVLAASFQRERPYRLAERRWRELARSAALAFVLADFPRPRDPGSGPAEVPLDPDAPAAREWSVVCVDEHLTACLAGWEQPREGGERAFEAVWSTDPDAVTATLRAAARLAGPGLAGRVEEILGGLSLVGAGTNAATLSLAGRMVGYLAAA